MYYAREKGREWEIEREREREWHITTLAIITEICILMIYMKLKWNGMNEWMNGNSRKYTGVKHTGVSLGVLNGHSNFPTAGCSLI